MESLDADRVLRRLAALVGPRSSAPTTTSPAPTAQPKPYISFKVASRELADLPDPKPYREIFVASPVVEGVHLRFGPVARGGLRWSDRRDDFRTEVLGLVKAQQVKNAVIVPVGSKGGFYPKRLPQRRLGATQIRAEAVERLQDLPPRPARPHRQHRRRRQGGPPGGRGGRTTATIPTWWSPPTRARPPSPTSPTAWPTTTASGWATPSPPAARPATTTRPWASPPAAPGRRSSATSASSARTSRPSRSPCVGVGDMSGDVFGNGMLLSRQIRLRRRLRPPPHLPRSRPRSGDQPGPSASACSTCRRSSWDDYDRGLISKGGGVFPRTLKSIAAQRRGQGPARPRGRRA